ncbi:MAG: HvfC/BufC family peptide modification chaperone [Bdellovibrionota bacterium]
MQLRGWQKQFREGMRAGGDALSLFLAAEAPSLGDRFRVYREGYWLRVSESLAEDFPLTERLVGKAVLESAMLDFVAQKEGYELELGELSPLFAEFLRGRAAPALDRSLQLDLLALESGRSPEPVSLAESVAFGVHPSARFFSSGRRNYVLWRAEGSVCRERISPRTLALLRCFQKPGGLEALGEKLEVLGEDPAFVQGTVAEWTQLGLIVSYGGK